jgi:type IV secretory pathway VirD2 relaxase
VRYIERDGVEKDGSKGVLYDAQGAVRARVFEQPRPGEKHQFRFIVSPEDGSERVHIRHGHDYAAISAV